MIRIPLITTRLQMTCRWGVLGLVSVWLLGCNRAEFEGAADRPMGASEHPFAIRSDSRESLLTSLAALRHVERIPEAANVLQAHLNQAAGTPGTEEIIWRFNQTGTMQAHRWVARDASAGIYVDANISRHGNLIGVWVLQNRQPTTGAVTDWNSYKTLFLVDCLANTATPYAVQNYVQQMGQGDALGPLAFRDDTLATSNLTLMPRSMLAVVGNVYCGSKALARTESVTGPRKPQI